jgi:enamine deaminase RidA (YjgF/YER057c/UK114 family)
MTTKTTHLDPEQTTQAMRNVLTVLAAAGTGPERTAITVVSTAGHARPGALVEIDAVAIIPDELPA